MEAVVMPTSCPLALISAPPLEPLEMGVVIWM